MSTPYPPQPRRLMRDPSKKLVGGVCSGLAKYLNMDVTLVRILTVVITLFTGIPIVLYLIALFVMPEERATPPQPPYVNGPQPGAYDAGFAGQSHQPPTYGAPAQPPVDQVWGPGGAPWEQPQTVPAPASQTAPAPPPQVWQQPTAESAEPTGYDTAPATVTEEESPVTSVGQSTPTADTETDESGTAKPGTDKPK
ncbi:MAG TPA: PspC domain-containing protein [Microlunatus sp.]